MNQQENNNVVRVLKNSGTDIHTHDLNWTVLDRNKLGNKRGDRYRWIWPEYWYNDICYDALTISKCKGTVNGNDELIFEGDVLAGSYYQDDYDDIIEDVFLTVIVPFGDNKSLKVLNMSEYCSFHVIGNIFEYAFWKKPSYLDDLENSYKANYRGRRTGYVLRDLDEDTLIEQYKNSDHSVDYLIGYTNDIKKRMEKFYSLRKEEYMLDEHQQLTPRYYCPFDDWDKNEKDWEL